MTILLFKGPSNSIFKGKFNLLTDTNSSCKMKLSFFTNCKTLHEIGLFHKYILHHQIQKFWIFCNRRKKGLLPTTQYHLDSLREATLLWGGQASLGDKEKLFSLEAQRQQNLFSVIFSQRSKIIVVVKRGHHVITLSIL